MKTLMPKVDTRDGLFHNGNPAIGEQGTQVKDVWLNDVQESLRDIQAEAHYVLEKAGFKPVENKQTQLYDSIVKIIGDNRKTATTKGKGEVKLNSATDSSSETEAATPKAVKDAFDNANNRVAKTGDTMTGDLSFKKGDWSGINLYNNDGYYLRLEGNDHVNGNMLTAVYRKPNGENVAAAFLPKRDGTIAYVDDVVRKTGDTMTGDLSFKKGDWSGINLYNNDGYYLRLEGNDHVNGNMLTAVYRKPNGENVAAAFLPKRDGTIAYVDDVVRKTGDTMTGTLTFTGATENYYIANYSWRMPIKFSGDMFIGNEVTGIGFNSNGSLNLGGQKNSPAFIATIDIEGIYTGGVVRATSHTAKAYGHGAFANQWDSQKAPYVVNNPNANGQNIYYPFIKGLNTNGNQYGTAFSFGYVTPGAINQFGSGVIHLITDSGNGRIWWFGHDGALRGDDFVTTGGRRLSDLPQERLIWQGSTDNQITVNAQVSKGVLFVLMDTPHGAQANRPIWFSSPIEHCDDTKIGDFNTGGTSGDYNFNTLALLSRNGTNITITPLNDGRKPRLKKVVVVG